MMERMPSIVYWFKGKKAKLAGKFIKQREKDISEKKKK